MFSYIQKTTEKHVCVSRKKNNSSFVCPLFSFNDLIDQTKNLRLCGIHRFLKPSGPLRQVLRKQTKRRLLLGQRSTAWTAASTLRGGARGEASADTYRTHDQTGVIIIYARQTQHPVLFVGRLFRLLSQKAFDFSCHHSSSSLYVRPLFSPRADKERTGTRPTPDIKQCPFSLPSARARGHEGRACSLCLHLGVFFAAAPNRSAHTGEGCCGNKIFTAGRAAPTPILRCACTFVLTSPLPYYFTCCFVSLMSTESSAGSHRQLLLD